MAISPATIFSADINEARQAFSKWAEVTTQVSQERNNWAREKTILIDTLEVKKAELEQLNAQIEEWKNSASASDEKKAEIQAKITEAQSTSGVLAKVLGESERKIRGILHLLPTHFRRNLDPVIARLPQEDTATQLSISQRLQTIATLMTQINNFSTGLSLFSEIRELPNGDHREVKTLYFGLGTAYFADASGSVAGYGAPGPEGWAWQTVEGNAAGRIRSAIAIHESEAPPAFVSLPVEIK